MAEVEGPWSGWVEGGDGLSSWMGEVVEGCARTRAAGSSSTCDARGRGRDGARTGIRLEGETWTHRRLISLEVKLERGSRGGRGRQVGAERKRTWLMEPGLEVDREGRSSES